MAHLLIILERTQVLFAIIPNNTERPQRLVWPQTARELPLAPKEEIPPRTDTRNEKGLAATRCAWVLMVYWT